MTSTSASWLSWVLIGATALIAALAGAIWLMTRMPGSSFRGTLPPLSAEEQRIRDRLAGHVQTLAGSIGERNQERPEALEAAADYIAENFRLLGYAPLDEPFTSRGARVRNIIAELPGQLADGGIIVVGAHYDSVPGGPGANDNATGVAAVLELSRLLAGRRFAQQVRFVAFVNEEQPYSYTHEMGSVVHANAARARDERITAMLSLETIGHYADAPESQHYPAPLSYLYPDRADFIGFVGNLRSLGLVRRCVGSFRRHARFPAEGAALPERIDGVGWSDHWSFWRAGYPALMVTDTAFFRYRHYHLPSDTPEKIDYERSARVVSGLAATITDLAAK